MAYASIPAVSVRSASACSVTASLQRVSAPPRIRTMAALQRRQGLASPSLRSRSSRALRVVCAAKPETVSTVCEIVKSQLALSDDKPLTPESKFSDLGADSLDTVEIVMALEEKFGISVEEENAGSITTVQEAADLIEKLIEARSLSTKA